MEHPAPRHRQEQPLDSTESLRPVSHEADANRAPRHRAESISIEPDHTQAERVEDARLAVAGAFSHVEAPVPSPLTPEAAPDKPEADPMILRHVAEFQNRLLRTARMTQMLETGRSGMLGNSDETRRLRWELESLTGDMAQLIRHYGVETVPSVVEAATSLRRIDASPSTRLIDINTELASIISRFRK